jgi:hypothetical protein
MVDGVGTDGVLWAVVWVGDGIWLLSAFAGVVRPKF